MERGDTEFTSQTINGAIHPQTVNKFNYFFTGIARSLVTKIPATSSSYVNYMKQLLSHSFGLIPTTPIETKNLVYTICPTHSKEVAGIDPTIAILTFPIIALRL